MNPQKMNDYTSTGRPLDPKYFPNLLIIILTPAAGVLAFILTFVAWPDESGILAALVNALWMSAAVFLTWGLSREIDPDYNYSAFLAVGLTFAGMYALSAPPISILSLFATMTLARIVSRIVGPPARLGDSIVALLLVTFATFIDSWTFALVGILAFLLDALMVKPQPRQFIFAGLSISVLVSRLLISPVESGEFTLPAGFAVLVISALYMVTMFATQNIKSGTDLPDYELDVRRVRAAMSLVLLAGLATALWDGAEGVIGMLPLWAALLGVSLFRLPITLRKLVNVQQSREQTVNESTNQSTNESTTEGTNQSTTEGTKEEEKPS